MTAQVYRVEYRQAPPSTRKHRFGALEPETMASILLDLERGELERPSDLFAYMLGTDPHVRSVWRTRVDGVAWAPIDVEPHPGDDPILAEDAAQVVRDWIASTDAWHDRFADMLWADAYGVAVLEHVWRPTSGMVHLDLRPTDTRDVRYRQWDRPELRAYQVDDAGIVRGRSVWIDLRSQPSKWLVIEPRNAPGNPGETAEMRAIAWPWLFKRWIEKYGLEGIGRLANGLLYMRVPRNTERATRLQHREDLERLSTDGVAIFDADATIPDPIKLLEMSNDPGQSTRNLIDMYNGEISKAVLGSGLNVEVGSTGGNRALGESQFATTTLPRLKASAARALTALRQQTLTHYLSLNRHLFGGRVPQPPLLTARIVSDEVTVDELALRYGRVTVDALRKSRGLPALGPEAGGDVVVEVVDAPGGAPTVAPFGVTHARSVEMRSTYPIGAPTPCASTSPLALALSARSDDPER